MMGRKQWKQIEIRLVFSKLPIIFTKLCINQLLLFLFAANWLTFLFPFYVKIVDLNSFLFSSWNSLITFTFSFPYKTTRFPFSIPHKTSWFPIPLMTTYFSKENQIKQFVVILVHQSIRNFTEMVSKLNSNKSLQILI